MKNKKAADKGKNTGGVPQFKRVSLTGNFTIYVIVFVAALIFTQALRSKASNIFFGFIFFLPWVMLLYTLTSRSTLKIYMLSDSATIAKTDPYSYKLRIINESILPYPFIDAVLTLPQKNSVRCADRVVRLAMSPMASYDVKNTVRFRFRGTYEIGVNCIYVYDFFRLIRVRVDVNMHDTVYVLPRRLVINPGDASATSDSARETKKDPRSYEKIEISDIREYQSGDPLKSIHWKLSSKSEEFVVRDYDTGSSKKTFVFCDLSARFPDEAPEAEPEIIEIRKKNRKGKKADAAKETATGLSADGSTPDSATDAVNPFAKAEALEKSKKRRKSAKARRENRLEIEAEVKTVKAKDADPQELAEKTFYEDMNEFCADGVVELTVATVLRELRDGNECTLFWFDRRSESGVYMFTLRGMEDFNTIYTLFATSPLCDASDTVARLSAMISDTQDVKQLYVTSAIDPDAVRDLCAMQGVSDGASFGATEIILYNPEERFAHKTERKLYIEGCRAQLASNGLKLAEGRID